MPPYLETISSKSGSNMVKVKKHILTALLTGALGLLLLYFIRPKPPAKEKTISPVFATSNSCGDLSSKKNISQILDTSDSPGDISDALRENASAIPPYVVQLLEKNRFKVTAVKANQTPAECQYRPESIPGRSQLCLDGKKGRLMIILRENEDSKYTSESQIGEALLTGVFSLVYDFFWFQPEQKRKEYLEGGGTYSAKKPFDASPRPLSEYQKFNFWRHTNLSKLKLFSQADFPYFEFDGSGPLSPSFARRSLNLLSREYYCHPESHKSLSEMQPVFYKEFSQSFACVLGKPWFMKDEDFKANCANPS